MIPPDSREAYEHLKLAGLVEGLSPLQANGDGSCQFELNLLVSQPNSEGLPARVRIKVVLPGAFPWVKSKVFLIDEETWRFPHMELKTGLLCLHVEQPVLRTPFDSLFQTLMETLEWLEDAAQGRLLSLGEPWELPDFRTTTIHGMAPLPVWSLESPASFALWADRIGHHGEVILRLQVNKKGLVPVQFHRTEDGNIDSPQPNPSFIEEKGMPIHGKWLILPTLTYTSHRPPQTFHELASMCSGVGINLWELLVSGAKLDAARDRCYILVGAPIPEKVGDSVSELHWQPIVLPLKWIRSAKHDRGCTPKRRWLQYALGALKIPWGSAENVASGRTGARGRLEGNARAVRICLIGCGAIGSMLAEHLVRGGIRDLGVFDFDTVEPGNLCRHALGPSDVDLWKSDAFARRFNGLNPDLEIRGHQASVPLPPANGFSKEWRELLEADAWIDCTAHDAAFAWISQQGRLRGKKVLHLYTNAHARMLTICCSGRHASCARVDRLLLRDISSGNTPFSMAEFAPVTAEVPLGAGCWHPAFPALGSDIQALVASAIPAIASYLGASQSSSGRAMVLRRNDLVHHRTDSGPEPLIEMVLNRTYRGGKS